MIPRSHQVGAWSGFAFIVILGIAMVAFARLFPPMSPSLSAEAVADFYQDRTNSIRFGLVLVMFGTALYMAWSVSLAAAVRSIDEENGFWAPAQLISGGLASLFFILPAVFMAVAAFRPEGDPLHIQMLNDIGWMLLITPAPPFMLQTFSLGVAILKDRSANPIFPRWLGYYTLWLLLILVPAFLPYFFKSGVFAWSGVFPYYLPFGAFFIWMPVLSWYLLKAAKA